MNTGGYLATSQSHHQQRRSPSSQQHLPQTHQGAGHNYPRRSRPASPGVRRRRSFSPDRDQLEDSNGGLSAEDLRDFHNQGRGEQDEEEDELEEDGGGIISPHPLDHFANLGIASRAPSRRGSPKPSQSHQRYRNSAIRTSPPSRAHSPPPLTFGQHQRQHVVLPPPTSLLSQSASVSRSSSSGNVKGIAELSALSMLASSELYELERKERERERERQAEHHRQQQQQYGHHPPYQPYPPLHSNSGTVPGMSSSSPSSLMTPPVPPNCHHEECQRSYRTALGVYQQAQSQSSGMRATLTNDGASPHDEYVTFPGPPPVTMSGGVTRRSDHPSSPGSTDSSELSRSPPIHIIRHNAPHPHQFNPYARPGAKFSPGTPRHLVPSTSPVLAPSQHESRVHASGPGPVPIPTTLAESAVRAGIKDHDADSDDGDVGDMDVDMR